MPPSFGEGMFMKHISIYTVLFSALMLAGCGGKRERPTNIAESLPNRMVPLDASAEDYADARLTPNQPGCQGGLATTAEGQLQLCCTSVTLPADISWLTLDEVKNCESGFSVASSTCTVETTEGEKEGALWKCDPRPVEANSTPIPDAPGDADDQALFDALVTPVAFTSGESTLRKIHATGTYLGGLPKELYVEVQKEVVGSTYPACNFFLITALCKSGYCEREKPFYLAAQFDDYFFREGWRLVKLEELKKLFKERQVFDSVLQKDNPVAGRPGHVVVPIGLDANGDVVIAQGNLGTVTNEIKRVSDSYVTGWQGGFNIFVKDQ